MKDFVCRKEAQRVLMLDLRSSLASSNGPRFGCNDNSQYLLMMLDFSIGTGLEYEGVVELDRDSWRMPDRLGCARIAAMLVFRFC